MPKQNEKLWKDFQKLIKNNGNNNYYVVTCKHCDHELIGRVKNMRTHLKKCSACKDVDDHSEILTSFTQIKEAKSSSSLKRSIVSTVSSGITWKKLKITQFMDPDLSAQEVELSNGVLLEYVAACSVPFQSVEHPAFKAYI
jgi:adenosyl cobinamide kinase/adenosyl cobinamide phosphate guanylyltransferase